MSLLFDLVAIQPSQGKFHGASEHGKAILLNFINKKMTKELYGFYNPSKWFDPEVLKIMKNNNVTLFEVWSDKDIQDLLTSGKFERFYSALPYNLYKFDFSNIDVIYTVHGLRDLEMPGDKLEIYYADSLMNKIKIYIKRFLPKVYENYIKKKFIKLFNINCKSKTILVPSNFTKFSIVNSFPQVKVDEIIVKSSPEKKNTKNYKVNKSSFLKKFNIEDKNYILLISGNRWIKNPIRVLLAFDSIFSEHPDLNQKVVILGSKKKLINLKNKDRFKWIDYVEEYELEEFYKCSSFFVYPTLNEGFGTPPLEAMKYGTPVIASAISAVTEVCSNAVLYFNPFCKKEIKNRILMFLYDKNLLSDYSKIGLKHYEMMAKKQDKCLDDICKTIKV